MIKKILFIIIITSLYTVSCINNEHYISVERDDRREFNTLHDALYSETVFEKKFIIMRQIFDLFDGVIGNGELNLFLTTYVEKNPLDPFNGYYLMIVARNYRDELAYPFAVHYYERILKNYQDLLVQGQSIHFLCLKDLVKFVKDPEIRIVYYKDL